MSSVFSLFNILALLYIFRSVQLSFVIWREWPELKSEPLTPHKKSLANQASFFIAVPIAVLVHEAAHALTVVLVGGQVAEFHYRVFWGYVVPAGSFTPAQSWLIAIAGTLGSIAFGLLLWLLTRRSASSSIRYFGLRALRFQVYFSLIYYPLFTLLGFNGDWRMIYDFSATPLLSAGTAVAHIAVLFLFWRGDRQGWFEAPAFADKASQDRFEQTAAEAEMHPQDWALQLQVIDALRRGGATRQATHQLTRLLHENPASGTAYLEMAALQSAGQSAVPAAAAESARKAIESGLDGAGQLAFAYELIGRYQSERGQLSQATDSFTEAINALNRTSPFEDSSAAIDLLLLRSQVYRRQGNYHAAFEDLQRALAAAQRSGDEAAQSRIRAEVEILEKHAGQALLTAPAEQLN
jgi:tetratricopeptide (TPR) repeat protein